MNNITKKYLINGPNNVVRLTNKDKVLYIFSDFHFLVEYQVECDNNTDYESIDIDKFLLKFIKKEKINNFDLFCEIEVADFTPSHTNYKHIYINQVRKLFKSNIYTDNNKIIQNKKYPNFRFHYFDFRDTIPHYNFIQYNYYQSFTFPYSIYSVNSIINLTETLIINLKDISVYLKSNDNIYINKILNSYQSDKIKKIINKIYNEFIIKNIEKAIVCAIEFCNFTKNKKILLLNKFNTFKVDADISSEILNKYYILGNLIRYILVILSDLFVIRRFLDKDYIKNGIVYTGARHTLDIIYILVNYFDFEVTHTYHSEKKLNISSLNNLIKKCKPINFNYLDELEKYLYNYDDNKDIIQCVNLFDFPDNFT